MLYFTLQFCHFYFFLNGYRVTADFLASNYLMPWSYRNSAFFPKMEAKLQQSSPPLRNPLQASFKDPPAPEGPTGASTTYSPKRLQTRQGFQCGRRAESSGILFQLVKREKNTKKTSQKWAGGRECRFPAPDRHRQPAPGDPPGSFPGSSRPRAPPAEPPHPPASVPGTKGRGAVPPQARRGSGGPRQDRSPPPAPPHL